MAVKAEFSADTSSFVKEVKKADDALAGFGKTSATMQKTVGQFDSALQQVGINVGPAAKAIDEIAGAAGKSALSLGVMGTAGIVLATGMAAWKITRTIAEFIGLDEAVAHATTTLLGWKDATIEAALAQNDVQMKAVKLGADLYISYADAIRFVADKEKERLAGLKDTEEAEKRKNAAWKELNSTGNDYAATLEKMDVWAIEEIKHYLEMGVSQGVLATAFGVTASQIKAVEQSTVAAKAADDAWLAGLQATAAEAAAYAAVLADLNTRINLNTASETKAVAALTMKTDAMTASILAESAARASLQQTTTSTDALTNAWTTMNTKLAELQKSKVGDIDTTARQQVIYNEYQAAALAAAQAEDQKNQAVSKAPAAFDATAAATDRATKAAGVYMNQLHMLVTDPKLAAFFGGNAAAVTLYSGGKGGFTPEEAAAMGAGQMINFAGNSFATGRIPGVNININSPLGTPSQIGAAVGNAMSSLARAQGQRF